MHKDGFYSSGEFARKANISVRTVRYYDKQNILKPSLVTDEGARFYTDSDFTRLQQVLLLKYIGFSLDDIRNITIGDSDYHVLRNSLKLQKRMVQDKIGQMQLVCKAIEDTEESIEAGRGVDWNNMLEIIHLTNMEDSMKNQYINAGNLTARIDLHSRYSVNRQGWFPWVYEQCGLKPGMRILEVGCGDGALWTLNIGRLAMLGRQVAPGSYAAGRGRVKTAIDVTDLSEGMVNDAERNIRQAMEGWKGRDIDVTFNFRTASCEETRAKAETYDCVIANHVLFYCEDIGEALEEVARVLKPDGFFVCSTYGSRHMQEISRLVTKFDSHIVLSSEKLFEKFGLENGEDMLTPHFSSVELREYEDELVIDEAAPVVDYILSCHGNQKEYLADRYGDFKKYVEKTMTSPMYVTKQAGVFVCRKSGA